MFYREGFSHHAIQQDYVQVVFLARIGICPDWQLKFEAIGDIVRIRFFSRF